MDWLSKLWYLELAQGWSPDGLPHGIPIVAQPPPPILAPPPASCRVVHGTIGKRLLASLKCTLAQQLLAAKCGYGIASLVALPLKGLKIAKTARGLYEVRKVRKEFRPLFKLLNDIKSAKILSTAPKGFRTYGEIRGKLEQVRNARDVILVLYDIGKAVPKRAYARIAVDVADLFGLKACVQALVNAVASPARPGPARRAR